MFSVCIRAYMCGSWRTCIHVCMRLPYSDGYMRETSTTCLHIYAQTDPNKRAQTAHSFCLHPVCIGSSIRTAVWEPSNEGKCECQNKHDLEFFHKFCAWRTCHRAALEACINKTRPVKSVPAALLPWTRVALHILHNGFLVSEHLRMPNAGKITPMLKRDSSQLLGLKSIFIFKSYLASSWTPLISKERSWSSRPHMDKVLCLFVQKTKKSRTKHFLDATPSQIP